MIDTVINGDFTKVQFVLDSNVEEVFAWYRYLSNKQWAEACQSNFELQD